MIFGESTPPEDSGHNTKSQFGINVVLVPQHVEAFDESSAATHVIDHDSPQSEFLETG